MKSLAAAKLRLHWTTWIVLAITGLSLLRIQYVPGDRFLGWPFIGYVLDSSGTIIPFPFNGDPRQLFLASGLSFLSCLLDILICALILVATGIVVDRYGLARGEIRRNQETIGVAAYLSAFTALLVSPPPTVATLLYTIHSRVSEFGIGCQGLASWSSREPLHIPVFFGVGCLSWLGFSTILRLSNLSQRLGAKFDSQRTPDFHWVSWLVLLAASAALLFYEPAFGWPMIPPDGKLLGLNALITIGVLVCTVRTTERLFHSSNTRSQVPLASIFAVVAVVSLVAAMVGPMPYKVVMTLYQWESEYGVPIHQSIANWWHTPWYVRLPILIAVGCTLLAVVHLLIHVGYHVAKRRLEGLRRPSSPLITRQ